MTATTSEPDWVRPIVHFEILARDPEVQRAFYSALFNWPIGDGPIMNIPSGLGGPEPGPAGHMRQSDRGGFALYIQVRDISESLGPRAGTRWNGRVAAVRRARRTDDRHDRGSGGQHPRAGAAVGQSTPSKRSTARLSRSTSAMNSAPSADALNAVVAASAASTLAPDLQHEPPIVMSTERAPKEPRLLVGELDLHAPVDVTEDRLVDADGEPKRHDLDHDEHATVRRWTTGGSSRCDGHSVVAPSCSPGPWVHRGPSTSTYCDRSA